ncbi:hypothetical protein AAZX31_13G053400 [Glycine max]|uniref:Seed maturation-like protein n=2 Tax=Glycine subgen. Soja TaxID=1462606 RepID=I1LWF9_SOYBN|nr:uncharacterized protein LOC100809010 [Glycine max]XP_028197752.1 uncharacterized protein LOC114382486 [Glycine soja]KAG4958801.1 hypothetical protein JHK87_035434 [Glycine soja]KRH18565.1 hypothetical protein GLYMA_13G068000v4 [Glycine max]RZB71214.1 hypothetical protein D0Y65_035939 [Glycine soja]|eukprot:XP_003543554.1 uncharacterized protein LOC100809010 [Glycine max]
MALSFRPLIHPRFTDRSLFQFLPPKPPPFPPPPPPSVLLPLTRRRGGFISSCLSDDAVSTRNFDRGFTVIAAMLRRIEPLDNSAISKGVSPAARDSMKQTISTMLGLLPSDHFAVTVTVSKHPLHRLLFSSIVTGYTLWNAEYRMSLARNLDMSGSRNEGSDCETCSEVLEVKDVAKTVGDEKIDVVNDLESCSSSGSLKEFGDLPSQALSYIQQLESELTSVMEELNAQKQEMMQLEYDKGKWNNLLEYLRSLDPDMVTELSRPSSLEVEDIIHQLVQNILRRFFVDDASSSFMEQSVEGNVDNRTDSDELSNTVATSRDYLAKLLFWCMLLGHHLRGLENRLHLSCVVGLL